MRAGFDDGAEARQSVVSHFSVRRRGVDALSDPRSRCARGESSESLDLSEAESPLELCRDLLL